MSLVETCHVFSDQTLFSLPETWTNMGSLYYDKCLKCYENCHNFGENDISDVTIVSRQLRKTVKLKQCHIGMRLKKSKKKEIVKQTKEKVISNSGTRN